MMYVVRRTNIYLAEEQLTALRALGDARGEPVSALVREAIAGWLEDQGVTPLDEDEWGRRFDKLLDRHSKIWDEVRVSDEELDRDVAAAVRETRDLRAATRRR